MHNNLLQTLGFGSTESMHQRKIKAPDYIHVTTKDIGVNFFFWFSSIHESFLVQKKYGSYHSLVTETALLN